MAEEYKTDHSIAQADKLDIVKLLRCPISLEVPHSASVDVDGEVFDTEMITAHVKARSTHPTKGMEVNVSNFKAVPEESLFASVRMLGEDGGPSHGEVSVYNASKLLQFEEVLVKSTADLVMIQEQLITAVLEGREYKGKQFPVQNMVLNPTTKGCANQISGYKKELKDLAELLDGSVPAIESKSTSCSSLKPEYIYAFDKKISKLKEKLEEKVTALEKNQESRNKLVANVQILDKVVKIEEEMYPLELYVEQEKLQLEEANKKLSGKDKAKQIKDLKLPPEEKHQKNFDKIAELVELINKFENMVSTGMFEDEKIAALQEKKRILQFKLTRLTEAQQENKVLFLRMKEIIRAEKANKNKKRKNNRKNKKTADANDEKRNVQATREEAGRIIHEKEREALLAGLLDGVDSIVHVVLEKEDIASKSMSKIFDIVADSALRISKIDCSREGWDKELNVVEEDVLKQLSAVEHAVSNDTGVQGKGSDEAKSDGRGSFVQNAKKFNIKQVESFEGIQKYAYSEIIRVYEAFNTVCTLQWESICKFEKTAAQIMANAGLLNLRDIKFALVAPIEKGRKHISEKMKKTMDLIYMHFSIPIASEAAHDHQEYQSVMTVAAAVPAVPTTVPAAVLITRVAAASGSPLHTTAASSEDVAQAPSATSSR